MFSRGGGGEGEWIFKSGESSKIRKINLKGSRNNQCFAQVLATSLI